MLESKLKSYSYPSYTNHLKFFYKWYSTVMVLLSNYTKQKFKIKNVKTSNITEKNKLFLQPFYGNLKQELWIYNFLVNSFATSLSDSTLHYNIHCVNPLALFSFRMVRINTVIVQRLFLLTFRKFWCNSRIAAVCNTRHFCVYIKFVYFYW